MVRFRQSNSNQPLTPLGLAFCTNACRLLNLVIAFDIVIVLLARDLNPILPNILRPVDGHSPQHLHLIALSWILSAPEPLEIILFFNFISVFFILEKYNTRNGKPREMRNSPTPPHCPPQKIHMVFPYA